MIKEFNIEYEHFISGYEDLVSDEVQFDVEADQSPVDFMREIIELANDFFDSNRIHGARIIGVEVA